MSPRRSQPWHSLRLFLTFLRLYLPRPPPWALPTQFYHVGWRVQPARTSSHARTRDFGLRLLRRLATISRAQALRTAVFTAFNKGNWLLQWSADSTLMRCAHVCILCYTSMSLTFLCRGSMRLQNPICSTLEVLRLGAVMYPGGKCCQHPGGIKERCPSRAA